MGTETQQRSQLVKMHIEHSRESFGPVQSFHPHEDDAMWETPLPPFPLDRTSVA
jgi:hypothetical protein